MGGIRTKVAVIVLAGAVAVSCGGDGDESGSTAPGATSATTTRSSTTPTTSPATSAPGTAAPATTQPTGDDPEPVVTEVGWDGSGSACVALGPDSTGCFPGGTITGAPTAASVRTGGSDWTIDVAIDAGEVTATAEPGTVDCDGGLAERPDAWLVGLACGQGGAALWTVLPDRPGGEVLHEAVRSTGDVVALTPLSVDGELRVFAANFDLDGLGVSCTLVVPRTGGWFESCDIPSPAHPGTRLVVHDGAAHHVDPVDGRVVPLGDAAMRTNGCDESVIDVVAELDEVVMLGNLTCRDGVATGAYGSVFVQEGPVDGSLVIWERADDGTWSVVDEGTGIEADPPPLPLPPLDLAALDADAPATSFEDVTETVRGWMSARPELTIAEAIAAGEGDDVTSEPIPTMAMAPLPSLSAVEVHYPDDSVTGARYAVWTTEPDDGSDPLMVAYRWTLCGRGVASEGLCV